MFSRILLLTFTLWAVHFTCFAQQKSFKVFQLNIWHEGTSVPKGYDAIVNEIIDKDADVVLLSEVNNKGGVDFVSTLLKDLKEKGHTYNGISNEPTVDVATISKYPILEQNTLYDKENRQGQVLKTKINIHNHPAIFYSVHLDYTNYACYLPRGYDGVTWKKMDNPITGAQEILTANRKSKRDEAIADLIADAAKESTKHSIIIGGDFNEPSHLDWIEANKNLYDRRGAVVPWDCSVMLYAAGYKDAFRIQYPNPLSHPGFTYPSFNPDVPTSKLAWAPEADDRDRIDYIYFKSTNKKLKLEDIKIVGPESTVRYAQKQEKDSEDKFLLPKGVWPTDHKGLLATFSIK
ncbi:MULTISPECIES: endonuclease/exonuclease/phosphatase family protein [Sphingobacterium]|uniref:Endonuclease/exonuclease/phosphatase family protein n=1 Tax=Sphingobacterium litopenaei TaxID=2763500 RepID=A0ABR7YEX1_9SPHI|nr:MULTISPECIES: endonuclease/exonuclease/phosphatase family protein [Sphingobacterium]MBD1429862.1 endonuclease/exonuclease/phosphatase family protein [Sphingobacterium litopenaei]NGM73703.1 endonuclease/exonuclease/phosphatase family protein [Sphingobacterium sp. SGL-16]